MPRELTEIRYFNAGTILSSDSSDIPTDAASFSLNLDCSSESGVLIGVPEDTSMSLISLSGHTISGILESPMNYIDIDGGEHLVIKDTSGWHIASNPLPKPGE